MHFLCLLLLSHTTESFYFDFNNENVLVNALAVERSNADNLTMTRKAVFALSDPHEGVYAILRVQRVLQGDQDEASGTSLQFAWSFSCCLHGHASSYRCQSALSSISYHLFSFSCSCCHILW